MIAIVILTEIIIYAVSFNDTISEEDFKKITPMIALIALVVVAIVILKALTGGN